jgi:hypothetical protein
MLLMGTLMLGSFWVLWPSAGSDSLIGSDLTES